MIDYKKIQFNIGIREGRLQGKREALLMQLGKRFPRVPTDIKRRIQQIDSAAEIEELLLAVLSVKSVRDLPFD